PQISKCRTDRSGLTSSERIILKPITTGRKPSASIQIIYSKLIQEVYFMAIESSVVFLRVKDIEETTRFYRDLIGLPVAQVQSGGLCRIFDTGYGYFGFCQ